MVCVAILNLCIGQVVVLVLVVLVEGRGEAVHTEFMVVPVQGTAARKSAGKLKVLVSSQ